MITGELQVFRRGIDMSGETDLDKLIGILQSQL